MVGMALQRARILGLRSGLIATSASSVASLASGIALVAVGITVTTIVTAAIAAAGIASFSVVAIAIALILGHLACSSKSFFGCFALDVACSHAGVLEVINPYCRVSIKKDALQLSCAGA
jgi:tetrahydromethanopterin S-methyltransferase subunit E